MHFDLLLPFPNIGTLPPFRSIYNLSLNMHFSETWLRDKYADVGSFSYIHFWTTLLTSAS